MQLQRNFDSTVIYIKVARVPLANKELNLYINKEYFSDEQSWSIDVGRKATKLKYLGMFNLEISQGQSQVQFCFYRKTSAN